MCGSSPSPPPVPDPSGVAASQFASNLAAGESAQAGSQVNQITPTGSLTYYQTGVGPNGVPTYSAVQQLTPAQQELMNLQQQGMGIAGGAGANLLANSFGQYSSAPNLSDMAGGETQKLLGQETSYLSPYFTSQTSQLDNQLRNQGIMPGTPAYNQQMMQLQGNQNQAVTGFLAQAEPSAFQQAESQYMLPLQTAQTLLDMNQPGNVNAPYTGQAPNYQPPNVIGATANAQQAEEQNYQAQMQQQSAMLSGLMGIGQAAMKFFPSDRRIKRDVTLVGLLKNIVLPIYRWRYLWSEEFHIGPIAQDVEMVMPGMVWTDDRGFKFLIGVQHG
jgi:hypothetical protein